MMVLAPASGLLIVEKQLSLLIPRYLTNSLATYVTLAQVIESLRLGLHIQILVQIQVQLFKITFHEHLHCDRGRTLTELFLIRLILTGKDVISPSNPVV